MSYLLLTNSSAGSHEPDVIERIAAELRRSAEVEVADCSGEQPDALGPILDRLDGRVLAVAGGDGTVHRVVQRLFDLERLPDTTIGIIPLGTGNDFARGIGIPLDPIGAAAVVRFGRPRAVDLLVSDDSTVVVNAAHAGVGAEAAMRAVPLKRWLGPLAYPAGAVLAGARHDGWRLRVEVEGETVADGTVLMVAAMNGPTIGGGTTLAPAAVASDGLIHVMVACTDGPVQRLQLGRRVRDGSHLDVDGVSCTTGRDVRISGEPVRHDVDGELTDPVGDRTYRIAAGAWRVLRAGGEADE